MLFERKLPKTIKMFVTDDCTSNGSIQVLSAKGIRVKQKIFVVKGTEPPLELEVKRVTGYQTFEVGPIGSDINVRKDLSDYTVAANTYIYYPEQNRPNPNVERVDVVEHEVEPILAKRVLNVDYMGNPYDDSNRLPVEATLEVSSVSNMSISNVSMVAANVVYPVVLPGTVKRFSMRMRTSSKFQVSMNNAFAQYFTIMPGNIYQEGDFSLYGPLTIYVRNAKPDDLEIIYWT
jgi:hypothetical protein